MFNLNQFNSDKKIVFDKNLITKEIIDHKTDGNFAIENKQLDDCFVLNDNKIEFSSPAYRFQLATTSKENFLQLYTPKNIPVIAIEPMTGISNSFNNKVGLQVLKTKKKYSLVWEIKLL